MRRPRACARRRHAPRFFSVSQGPCWALRRWALPAGAILRISVRSSAWPRTAQEDDEQDSPVDALQYRRRLRSRGAIDIVKGLEQKKALRREKMLAKCRKQREQREQQKKPLAPGRGAQRMRCIGIEAHNNRKGIPEPLFGGKEGFVLSV